jgi:hypothetical protein
MVGQEKRQLGNWVKYIFRFDAQFKTWYNEVCTPWEQHWLDLGMAEPQASRPVRHGFVPPYKVQVIQSMSTLRSQRRPWISG